MDFRRHPEHEVSGGGFLWRNTLGCAIFQVIIHRGNELGAQFGDRFSVKTDDGAHPKLDPRAFAFQDLAAECKDERLNIGKCDGSRSGLPKESLQGLLVTFLHRYMIAKCANISHACRCDATAANVSVPGQKVPNRLRGKLPTDRPSSILIP